MTDNEIIKALEHCKQPAGKHDCKHCPFVLSKGVCTTWMLDAAIALLNRQKAEIERLEAEISGMEIGIKTAKQKVMNTAYKGFGDELEYEILHKEFWNDYPSTSEIWLNGYEQCLRDMRAMLKDKVKEMVGEG